MRKRRSPMLDKWTLVSLAFFVGALYLLTRAKAAERRMTTLLKANLAAPITPPKSLHSPLLLPAGVRTA